MKGTTSIFFCYLYFLFCFWDFKGDRKTFKSLHNKIVLRRSLFLNINFSNFKVVSKRPFGKIVAHLGWSPAFLTSDDLVSTMAILHRSFKPNMFNVYEVGHLVSELSRKWYWKSNILLVTLGPDRLELIIFHITNKKICNLPCRL